MGGQDLWPERPRRLDVAQEVVKQFAEHLLAEVEQTAHLADRQGTP